MSRRRSEDGNDQVAPRPRRTALTGAGPALTTGDIGRATAPLDSRWTSVGMICIHTDSSTSRHLSDRRATSGLDRQAFLRAEGPRGAGILRGPDGRTAGRPKGRRAASLRAGSPRAEGFRLPVVPCGDRRIGRCGHHLHRGSAPGTRTWRSQPDSEPGQTPELPIPRECPRSWNPVRRAGRVASWVWTTCRSLSSPCPGVTTPVPLPRAQTGRGARPEELPVLQRRAGRPGRTPPLMTSQERSTGPPSSSRSTLRTGSTTTCALRRTASW